VEKNIIGKRGRGGDKKYYNFFWEKHPCAHFYFSYVWKEKFKNYTPYCSLIKLPKNTLSGPGGGGGGGVSLIS